MSLLAAWVRSLIPTSVGIAAVMWTLLALVGLIRWGQGTFVSVDSLGDAAYRLAAFVLLPLIAGILCALCADVSDRMQLWRTRRLDRDNGS